MPILRKIIFEIITGNLISDLDLLSDSNTENDQDTIKPMNDKIENKEDSEEENEENGNKISQRYITDFMFFDSIKKTKEVFKLKYPEIKTKPINEFKEIYICKAFPTLFPYGMFNYIKT